MGQRKECESKGRSKTLTALGSCLQNGVILTHRLGGRIK